MPLVPGPREHFTQVMSHVFKDSCFQSATGLVAHDRPERRKLVRHEAPLSAGSDQPPHVEDRSERMHPLRGILSHQGQIRGQKGPFVVGDIARIDRRWLTPARNLPQH